MVGRNTLLTNQSKVIIFRIHLQFIHLNLEQIFFHFLFNYYNLKIKSMAKLMKSIANLKDGNFYYIETLTNALLMH